MLSSHREEIIQAVLHQEVYFSLSDIYYETSLLRGNILSKKWLQWLQQTPMAYPLYHKQRPLTLISTPVSIRLYRLYMSSPMQALFPSYHDFYCKYMLLCPFLDYFHSTAMFIHTLPRKPSTAHHRKYSFKKWLQWLQ